MKEIKINRETMVERNLKIREMSWVLISVLQDSQAIRAQIDTLEERVSKVEDLSNLIRDDVRSMKKRLELYEAKLKDMKNQQRRLNLRILGLLFD